MADADIRMRFFGSPEDAERAIVQLERKYATLQEQVKRTGRASKEAVSPAIKELESLAFRVVSVSALVQAGTMVWQRYAQSIDEVAKAEANLRQLAASSIATASNFRGIERLEFARSVPGVLPEQVMAALTGVEAGGAQLGKQRQQELATAFSALAPALAPLGPEGKVSDTSQLENAANIGAMLADAFADKASGDIVDMTLALQRSVGPQDIESLRTGKFEVALSELQKQGIADERALAMLAVGVESGRAPKELLKKEVFEGLDQGKIAAIERTLVEAQTGDAALQFVREAADVNRLGMVLQEGAVAGRATRGDAASLAEMIDTTQRNRWQRTQGFWGATGEIGREFLEESAFIGAQVVPGQWHEDILRREFQGEVNQQSGQSLKNIEMILTQIRDQGRNERPRVNRPPPVEGQ